MGAGMFDFRSDGEPFCVDQALGFMPLDDESPDDGQSKPLGCAEGELGMRLSDGAQLEAREQKDISAAKAGVHGRVVGVFVDASGKPHNIVLGEDVPGLPKRRSRKVN
ncbi:MAG: hypothetical protein WC873_03280 [Candidatus Gracilibacteria bacterium]